MEESAASAVQLTAMLRAWSEGDASALERLTPIVYSELRRLAHHRMLAEGPDHVLQPSALVNEAFIRLMDGPKTQWRDRTHFFAVSARLMRRILVDFARTQNATKRGSGVLHLGLTAAEGLAVAHQLHDFIDLDVALEELARLDGRRARVVELRYFGGLDNAHVAELLGISEDTVMRDWRGARAWLLSRLEPA